VEWRPTKRRNVAGDVVLPAPFTVGLADTPPVIDVAPTEPGWAWQVVERVQGGSPKARYLTVPDSATVVDYADLIAVDPATLDRALAQLAPKTAADPAVMSSPPTFALSGPGGASPITNFVRFPHNTDRVTVLSGSFFATDYNPTGTPAKLSRVVSAGYSSQPFWVEFNHYGASFALRFLNNTAGQSKLWVWVDGQPATSAPTTLAANSTGDLFRYLVTFAGTARRVVRIYMEQAAFAGVEIGPIDSLSPTAHVAPRCYWLGDSYIEGANGVATKDTFGATACKYLGWEFLGGGEGGTGYTNNGGGTSGKTPFGEASRIAALAALQPDWVVVVRLPERRRRPRHPGRRSTAPTARPHRPPGPTTSAPPSSPIWC
jgi:hypothetical protein